LVPSDLRGSLAQASIGRLDTAGWQRCGNRQLDCALVIIDLIGIGRATKLQAARTGRGAQIDASSLPPTAGKRRTVRHPRKPAP